MCVLRWKTGFKIFKIRKKKLVLLVLIWKSPERFRELMVIFFYTDLISLFWARIPLCHGCLCSLLCLPAAVGLSLAQHLCVDNESLLENQIGKNVKIWITMWMALLHKRVNRTYTNIFFPLSSSLLGYFHIQFLSILSLQEKSTLHQIYDTWEWF